MSERSAIFAERERNGELVRDVVPAPAARCWQCGRVMPVKATPEMCPSCHHLNFVSKPPGVKPTLAEWEAVGRAYGEALDREDLDAMQEAEEVFWALACRVAGIGGAL